MTEDNEVCDKQANELCAKTWSFSESTFWGDLDLGRKVLTLQRFRDFSSPIPFLMNVNLGNQYGFGKIFGDFQADLGNFRANLGSAESQKEKVF